jgi:cyclohexa-1,5-dienecarbonyl-CoA hydratase
MPRGAAEAMLFSGQPITAEEAWRLGLVHALSADPEVAALAWFDQTLAPLSPSSLRYAVRAARFDVVERVRAKLAVVETLYLSDLMSSQDAVEGLTAFLEKRPAKWETAAP